MQRKGDRDRKREGETERERGERKKTKNVGVLLTFVVWFLMTQA